MVENIKDFLKNFFSNRTRVVTFVFYVFGAILVLRLFVLQIVSGNKYQDNYNLKLEKTETIPATRGNIYDRNGQLLAYNELVYAVTIEDIGTYSNKKERNKTLNAEICEIIKNLERNGDDIDNNFGIFINSNDKYEFVNSGTALMRFRADIFGYNTIDELTYNDDFGFNEADATADEIMDYLCSDKRYGIDKKYDPVMRYKIAIVRYNMGQNSYKKYISTIIASDVSEETVAYISENKNELTGVEISEKSMRKYVDSEYYSHIIGYTGQISSEEYEALSKDDSLIENSDIVGKSGIENVMNDYLSGTKGHQTLYVDSVGNTIAVGEYKAPVNGNDVYLSIDKDLQAATYKLLEQQIAGIVYSKIVNSKEFKLSDNSSAADIVIPIYDVYNALIENNLISIKDFKNSDATDTEKAVRASYEQKEKIVLATLKQQLNYDNTVVYDELPKEYQTYSTYIVTLLKANGIFDSSKIDNNDEIQKLWTSEKMPVNQYLTYAIEQNWIDITSYEIESKYADTNELYNDLIDYVLNELVNDVKFTKLIYKYLILEDGISGSQLCVLLYDQGILEMEEGTYSQLLTGRLSAFNFLKNKIYNLEITPGQLGLDPCTGSSVVMDAKTGEILACVSYPGFDNNKLANSVDSSYYSYLLQSKSNPLYNYATQQRTAPGSTFKIVSSTAGLAEHVITTTETIQDKGMYEKVSNKPKCWYYPSTHGFINVSQAIRDSCNYFFYEVGFRLAGDENYTEDVGVEKLNTYASLYGLDQKTGIEIEENEPHIATEYPVMAAIGQSDNNFSTISLARYCTAIASRGKVYDLTLLEDVKNAEGEAITGYSPTLRNTVNVLNSSEWDAIHYGMKMVVESSSAFAGLDVEAAGKTGTAQQVRSRPNHALFIGFAPYNNPEITIATRIAYGYTSANAAKVSSNIMSYYFGISTSEEIMNGQASNVSTTNTFTD